MNKETLFDAAAFNSLKKTTYSLAVLFPLILLLACQSLQAQTQVRFPAFTKSADAPQMVSPRALRNNPEPISADEFAAPNRAPQTDAPNAEGDVDPTFNAGVTEGFGFVEQTIVQPDGKILVGGSFSGVGGAPRSSLARLNADGTLDATFNPGGAGSNGDILALALQPDGKILIGSTGALYNGVFVGTFTRLNADGTPDAFNSGSNADGIVETIAVQPDGKIIIGGLFSSYNGAPRGNIARVNADGSLDATFNPGGGFNDPVLTVVAQPDGKILAGGFFTNFNGVTVGRIARLNADGTLDTTFNPGGTGANTSVESIILQPDGKILVAGRFPLFNGTATPFGLVRLNPNGTIENAFAFTNITGSLTAVGLLPNGTILLGGTFVSSSPGGTFTSRGIVPIYPVGTTPFQPGNTNGDVLDITVQPDGKVLVSGSFTQYDNSPRRRLVRLNQDGTVDNSFQAVITSAGIVNRIVPVAGGKVLVGGDFQFANGSPVKALIRLNADGSLDSSFNANAGSAGEISIVNALAVQPDGKIVVGGSFTSSSGSAISRVVRLNHDGSLDANFNSAQTALFVNDIELQPDGKILVGGLFSQVPGGFVGIVRLNSDGSSDGSFSSFPTSAPVQTITVAPDGKIYVGGRLNITVAPGVSSRGAVRLNANGTIDSSFVFRATISVTVNAIAVLPDGKILLAGNLYNLSGVRRSIYRVFPSGDIDTTFNQAGSGASGTILSLAVQPDGKILIGGFFTIYNSAPAVRIARLNQNGTLDTTFNTGAGANDAVRDIAFQTDGKILLGGEFTAFNNQPPQGIVRLSGTAIRRTPFDFDGDGRADLSVFRPSNGAWYIEQSTSGFTGALFGVGTDKIVPADYDGDGKTDLAVFRSGTWYLQRSTLGFAAVQFGEASDFPMPGDFSGDGKADIAVFRPSNGTWYILQGQTGLAAIQFGQNGDVPVAADYDGDGITDIAVYRVGVWYIRQSQLGFVGIAFGQAGDRSVPADYDGDGKTDVAVYRDGTWYIQRSQAGFAAAAFGTATDAPAPADYDGDAKADLAVFRSGVWYLQRSSQGFSSVTFGTAGDKPVPGAFVP